MNSIIQSALKAVNDASVESSAGLELALDKIGALNPNLPPDVQRTALIDVIAPVLERHPISTSEAYSKLHSPIDNYRKEFEKHVAPTICNLFLFQ